MQKNSILLENISTDQLAELITTAVKNEIDGFKKHFQPKEANIYLTRNEVATLLSVDLSTVHNYCKRGILHPKGIGGRVYFLRSQVEASLIPLNQ